LERSDRVRQIYQSFYRVGGRFRPGHRDVPKAVAAPLGRLVRLRRALSDVPRGSGQQPIEGPMG